jgi:hypothetical protein
MGLNRMYRIGRMGEAAVLRSSGLVLRAQCPMFYCNFPCFGVTIPVDGPKEHTMSATRRLDILAIIGGVLAVVAIVVTITTSRSANVPQDQGREIALRSMPDSDMCADFEVLTEWPWGKDALPQFEKTISRKDADSSAATDEYEKQKRLHTLPVLADAVRRFPESARIQFRLGTLGDQKQRMAALRRAADLDRMNAYPLYALTGICATAGKYDQALQFLSQGNQRPYAAWYPIPYEGQSGSMFPDTLVSSANSAALLAAMGLPRRAASRLSKYADRLRLSGKNDQALAVSNEVRRMGWRLIREGAVNSLDVYVGVAVVTLAERPEKRMYSASGDKAGLARIERDEKELTRLKAGARAYSDIAMDKLMRRVARFAGLSWAFSVAIAGQALLLLLISIWWLVLALRSRGQSASELHESATDKSFPAARLMRMEILVFVAMVALSCIPVVVSNDAVLLAFMAVATVFPLAPIIGVAVWANLAYKRGYLAAAESTGETVAKPWKGYLISDKRERQRRLTGIMGGVMIALAVWGVGLSAYMSATMNSYPWQVHHGTSGLYQEETKYVHDLVTGKIKVPEKYIRAVEKQDAARKK